MTDPFPSHLPGLFPTAVIVRRVPDAERLNGRLKDMILCQRDDV